MDPRYIETAPLSHIEYWHRRAVAFERRRAEFRERVEREDAQFKGT